MRSGDWKLVAIGPRGAWELYDAAADRGEQRDLAASQPERAAELAGRWKSWAERSQVIPWIWGLPYGREAADKPVTPERQKSRRKAVDSP